MLRPVPTPRDAETVVAVRPPGKSSAAAIAIPPAGDEPPLDAPVHSGAMEIGSPYRRGEIIAGRYRLDERLGRGGMGEVWSARHVVLHTAVAVKFPSIALRGRAATMALERFRFEAQVAATLGSKTPYVVAVHDAGCDAAGPYLVMEHVRGRTLQQEIDDSGVLPLAAVAMIVAQVAEALAVAHAHGVVHRDLKPSNLLLATLADGSQLVKVADFGIAKALHADLGADLPEDTTGGFMIGSPPYMSPEQIGGGTASMNGDLWALAVIAYEAITGRLPFPGRSFAELLGSLAVGRFDPPSAYRPDVPAAVDAWFRRALAREEARRYEAARPMAAALRDATAGPPASARSGWTARAALHLRHFAGLFAARAPAAGLRTIEERASQRNLG